MLPAKETDDICCFEFSAYSEENPFGYDDFPDFTVDIWSLIIKNKHSIGEVIVEMSLWDRLLNCKNNAYTNLGEMNKLSSSSLSRLANKSYYGGHLSVIYKVRDESFVTQLSNLWKRDPIEVKIDEIPRLTSAFKNVVFEVLSRDRSCVCISFGHDADPMYLFCVKDRLTSLCGAG